MFVTALSQLRSDAVSADYRAGMDIRRLFTFWHPPQIQGDEVLRRAASVLTRTGEDFLPAVVREVAEMLRANLVYVAEFTSIDRMRTIALWRDGAPGEPLDCALAGTPLEQS